MDPPCAPPRHRHQPRKTFALALDDDRANDVALELPGCATLADLATAAVAVARAHWGAHASVGLLGLPASEPGLALDDLKIKAPHPLRAVLCAPGTPPLSPRSIVARSGASALSLREIDESAVAWSDEEEIEARIATRVRAYRSGFMELGRPDPDKPVLVLDVDFTLLDTDVYNRCSSANLPLPPGGRWLRPGLHELLASASPSWSIVLWSATGMGHIVRKLVLAGVLHDEQPGLSCPHVFCIVDFGAMLRLQVRTTAGGAGRRDFNTKPLAVLAGLFPGIVASHNTLIVDDHRRSFVLDSERGLHVTPYHSTPDAT